VQTAINDGMDFAKAMFSNEVRFFISYKGEKKYLQTPNNKTGILGITEKPYENTTNWKLFI